MDDSDVPSPSRKSVMACVGIVLSLILEPPQWLGWGYKQHISKGVQHPSDGTSVVARNSGIYPSAIREPADACPPSASSPHRVASAFHRTRPIRNELSTVNCIGLAPRECRIVRCSRCGMPSIAGPQRTSTLVQAIPLSHMQCVRSMLRERIVLRSMECSRNAGRTASQFRQGTIEG